MAEGGKWQEGIGKEFWRMGHPGAKGAAEHDSKTQVTIGDYTSSGPVSA